MPTPLAYRQNSLISFLWNEWVLYLAIKWMTAVITNKSKEKKFHCWNQTQPWHSQSVFVLFLWHRASHWVVIHHWSDSHLFLSRILFSSFVPSSWNLSCVKSVRRVGMEIFVLTLKFLCTWHIQCYAKLSLSHYVCFKTGTTLHSCLTSLTVFRRTLYDLFAFMPMASSYTEQLLPYVHSSTVLYWNRNISVSVLTNYPFHL